MKLLVTRVTDACHYACQRWGSDMYVREQESGPTTYVGGHTTLGSRRAEELAESWQANQRVAISYARRLVGDNDADDVVSDAFARILARSAGGGQVEKFRPYLLAVIHSVAIDHGRRRCELPSSELMLTTLESDLRTGAEGPDLAETEVLRAALASLPQHVRDVLVASEVDGESLGEIAAATGRNANAVAAQSYRAREALRQAYLAAHLQLVDSEQCRHAHELVPAYVRDTLAPGRQHELEEHLAGCQRCAADVEAARHLSARMPHLAGTRSRAAARG